MAENPEWAALTPTLRAALADCAGFGTYLWKPKAMEKLAALGLVERVPNEDRAGQLAYRITAAGKAAMTKEAANGRSG